MFLRRLSSGVSRLGRAPGCRSCHRLSSAIEELNKEMESIFGEPPSNGFVGSASKITVDHESRHQSVESTNLKANNSQTQEPAGVMSGLTHVGTSGEAQMVDVSSKENTKRIALASCKVILGKKVFDLVLANQMGKGDVLGVAKISGINGAKQTSSLIPLCHNITITHVRVDLRLNPEDFSVDIQGEASCTGKTGVEMEALTAVSVAGLTVYDMCKAASKDIRITDVRLDRKTGGKSGSWSRGE
ncbi:PREDICTED: cyclic pyranopterin monophosphate synthase accessory protein, mitochondrial [Tarenaya hassleriana]|uniref:cyclic pyranopterin monophosphate synthase accessory protein, mitochondrial n=1 Tax=Tarenaya hassleriana TaxID=28532 RepID=UPI00053C411A|nr:PREDICTED: cyclic pyranopterin monophosphate synthase accessory protein, mitochondrial [Tarenaya hassleriana]